MCMYCMRLFTCVHYMWCGCVCGVGVCGVWCVVCVMHSLRIRSGVSVLSIVITQYVYAAYELVYTSSIRVVCVVWACVCVCACASGRASVMH